MRASRLLSILLLLQSRGRLSAPALAAELDVSVRTVLRDMDQLSAAGVPVYAERGREGGFELRAGWSTQLTGLTEAEAQALFLAGLPGAATELGLGSASSSARLKVLASLPEALRAEAARVNARLHIDAMDWYRSASPPPRLQAVARAVWQQRQLQMTYDGWKRVSQPVVRPLGLVLKAGIWYLVALPEAEREPRTYRLSSILGLTLLDKTFKPPKAFNLARHWQASTRRFEAEIYSGTATLRASAQGLRLLKELSSAVAEAVARTAQADPDMPRWIRVTVPIESVPHATRQFLGLGTEVEVLQPAALRRHLRAAIGQLARLYAD
ncbi:YafY family protein [Ideonella sp. A 288]|uniref:helix-turn-helix transcriptional regulator n=1 Tax=Ideonella sp. A 288 TaxID=1962181 RepID=UPI000B4C0370|nr:YafY family protein [Ideonella sp. A 288]